MIGDDERRFELLPSARWLVPAAIALGLVGAAVATNTLGHFVFGGGAVIIGGLWALARRNRPTLIVDPTGFRVVEAGKERLRVAFDEIKRGRAVPAERAMYLDCGDPKRNLLLPTRHGYGFRFARQAELYVFLAKHLEGKLEIVETLVPPDKKESPTQDDKPKGPP